MSPSLDNIMAYLRANQEFGQQSGGAPLTEMNRTLLQQANQPEFDLMGALEQAQSIPGPRRGFSENFAQALAGMQFASPSGFGEGLVQGLARGFSGATTQRQRTAEEKAEARRSAASELAKARWERRNEEKDLARKALQSSAEKAMLESGRMDRSEANRQAQMDRLQMSLVSQLERAARAAERAESRDVLMRQRFDVNNLFAVNRAVAGDIDVKNFRAVRAAYEDGKTAAAAGNSSGDIVLMRMLAKATDPTTGVREEEYRTFEGAQGALSRLQTLGAKMVGKGQLTPYGRAELLKRLKERYDNSKRSSDMRMQHFRRVAGSVGVPWELVEQDFGVVGPEPQSNPLDASLGGSGY